MSQTPEEEMNIAVWNALLDELPRLGITKEKGMLIADATATLSQRCGIAPEKVMRGLLEGVQRGELLITDDTVRYQ